MRRAIQTPQGVLVGEGMAISVNHLKVGIDGCVLVDLLAGAGGVSVVGLAAYADAGGVVLGVIRTR